MLKRSARIGLEVVAAIIAVAVIAGGVLVWRASQGPVTLDFLTPHLERALSDARPDVEVSVGGTVLTWRGWPETFALRLSGLRVLDPDGQAITVPEAEMQLSLPALVHGTIAPTSITARGAFLTIVRGAEGFRFGAADETARSDGVETGDARQPPADQDVSAILPDILADLLAEPNPENRLSYLSELRIADAAISIQDEVLGAAWYAPSANVDLRRTRGGLAGQADLKVALGAESTELRAELTYVQGNGEIDIEADVDRIALPALAGKLPVLEPAAGITVPLSAQVRTTVDLTGGIGNSVALIRGSAGAIAWPRFVPEPRPVRELSARVRLEPAADRLALEDLRIAFGTADAPGPVVRADAVLSRDGGDLGLKANASAEDLAVNDLAKYWPPGLQEEGNAREWVTKNIRNGTAESAEVEVALTAPDGKLEDAEVQTLEGRLVYEGLSVHYLRPMPPVTGVDGTANFDADAFRFDVAGGGLADVQVNAATVTVTGLSKSDQFLDIELATTGPLPDTLAPLAHPRLDLLSELGIDPETTRGSAQVQTSFAFPLLDDLTMDGVEVSAQAQLRDVAITKLVLDRDVTDGQLDVNVDKRGMDIVGPLALAGVPLDITWRENFEDTADYQRQIEAQVPNLDSAGRERLGLSTEPFLSGPLSANLNLRSDGDGSGRLKAALNLKDAALSLPLVDWLKPAGEPGNAAFSIALQNETLEEIDSFTVEAGADRVTESGETLSGLRAQGSIDFAPGAEIREVRLPRFRIERHDLRDIQATRDDNGWRLRIGGGTLDAAPLLEMAGGRAGPGGQRDAPESGAGQPRDPAGPAIEIVAPGLSRVRLGPDRHLDDVAVRARRGPDGTWHTFEADATVPARFDRLKGDATSLRVRYAPRDDGRQRVRVETANAGAALRALNINDSILGGSLTIDGTARGAAPGSAIDADVDLRDFQVRNAPVLARILTVAVLTGIAEVLRGDGLGFQSLSGEVTYRDGVLATEFLHAYGPSLGITAEGRVDISGDGIDLRGAIVPAAMVNRVLGAIPLLGQLLTGGKGEGFIAVTYKVRGPLSDPDVSVNPLSALTPGFLRGLFGLLDDGGQRPEHWPRVVPDGDAGR